MNTPVLLLILDGWGQAAAGKGNAVSLAKTPNLDRLMQKYPVSLLKCSQQDVGLPSGQMGNSEVGHLNLGAGRIVHQDISRIDNALKNNELVKNPVLQHLAENTRKNGGRIHLLGLVSDGGVHSRQRHLEGLILAFQTLGVKEIFIHAFLDGRDTPPDSAFEFLQQLQNFTKQHGAGKIATISGRYYAMDRDKRWERIQLAFDTIVHGKGILQDWSTKLQASYAKKEFDEFIVPTVCDKNGCIRDKDSVLFFNFRADRVRELCRSFFDTDFFEFDRGDFSPLQNIATMTLYDESFPLPILFPPQKPTKILGEVLAQKGLRQLRIAETEKYAHVTYFFNGGEEKPFAGESRILVDSPKDVATYDLKPEMSVNEVSRILQEKITNREFDVFICNFANLDMVGHSGIIPATIAACEAVDKCVGEVIDVLLAQGGNAIITADHGNAEDMLDENGKPKTSHSLNPVAAILVGEAFTKWNVQKEGRLADVAPTILQLVNIKQPTEMTGKTLLTEKGSKK